MSADIANLDFMASCQETGHSLAKPGPMISGEVQVTQLGKSMAFVEGKLTAADGTVRVTATAVERLLDAAKAIR